MITSRLIADILDLLLDGDVHGISIRRQIPFLTEAEHDYTGVGVYIKFEVSEGIETCLYEEGSVLLDGVEIKSSELAIGAEAKIYVRDGIVKILEIWSYDGVYPNKELSSYTIRQIFSQDIEKNRGFIRW